MDDTSTQMGLQRTDEPLAVAVPEPIRREVKRRQVLPVEAVFERKRSPSRVRVPLRSELIRLEKRTVITERVTIRRRRTEGLATLSADVRREELRVEPIEHFENREGTRPFTPGA